MTKRLTKRLFERNLGRTKQGGVIRRVAETYFPEPDVRDDTWAADDERPVDWLQRSTLPRAKSIRDALNANLNQLEPQHAESLAKKLLGNWKAYYFELVVGRWLQELGARVEHEPPGVGTMKRIDYRATFPMEGAVSVEAVSKEINQHAVPGIAYFDNSEARVRRAYLDPDKREQARGAKAQPAFLAVNGGIFGADVEEFDRALLGYTVEHHGFERERVGYSFDATKGEMLRDADGPWAGVLAFVAPGVFGASDPVLYVSPHFDGHLPFAFLRLRRRMLGIVDLPASGGSAMSRVRFAEPMIDGAED
jgi:hypothetical protein